MLNPNTMKKIYLFLFLFCAYNWSFSQSDCAKVQAHILYAYNNAKTAYEANNITHLKFYSNKAFESFKLVKQSVESCNCDNISDYTFEAMAFLSKVPNVDSFEDSQFYVVKARDLAKKITDQLDKCTTLSKEENQLSQLEFEKMKLKQQQEELLLKQQEIETRMAEKEQKEIALKKEQFIIEAETAMAKNINSFNSILLTCKCDTQITSPSENKNNLNAKSLEEIRKYYVNQLSNITSNYLVKLKECN